MVDTVLHAKVLNMFYLTPLFSQYLKYFIMTPFSTKRLPKIAGIFYLQVINLYRQ
jgi:hypothetical protein